VTKKSANRSRTSAVPEQNFACSVTRSKLCYCSHMIRCIVVCRDRLRELQSSRKMRINENKFCRPPSYFSFPGAERIEVGQYPLIVLSQMIGAPDGCDFQSNNSNFLCVCQLLCLFVCVCQPSSKIEIDFPHPETHLDSLLFLSFQRSQ
jgi:hypothetical protein